MAAMRGPMYRGNLAVALAATVLAGCIYVSETLVERGVPAPDESTLAAVQEGVTTRDWVLSALGEPHYRVQTDGVERFHYHYVWCEKATRRILFVSRSSQTMHELRLTFEIKDGLVVRYRRERTP